MKNLILRLKDDFKSGNANYIIIYAHNGTGKTRLSMDFKENGRRILDRLTGEKERHTLYFNALTEDLFTWDNDRLVLIISGESIFSDSLNESNMVEEIRRYLNNYVKIYFDINKYTLPDGSIRWEVSFLNSPSSTDSYNIKVSRGEERIFIWCLFLAIAQYALDGSASYSWVKYIYIDDPISSVDDNSAIGIAVDLASILKSNLTSDIRIIVSTHHSLFFNILFNELHGSSLKSYFLFSNKETNNYTLQNTNDTPFFQHVSTLIELKKACKSGKVYTYHFNALRSIMEKTSVFFGHEGFSYCLEGVRDENVRVRALNIMSHGPYSVFDSREMNSDTKKLFSIILDDFIERFQFNIPLELT